MAPESLVMSPGAALAQLDGKLGVKALEATLLAVPIRKKAPDKGVARVHVVCDCRASAIGPQHLGPASHTTASSGDDSSGTVPGCAPSSTTCKYYGKRRLYTFEEAPPVLQYNQFIRTGYRAGLSYGQCVCSIFQCHNETGNILTHLLPALLLLCLLARQVLAPWPNAHLEFWQNIGSIFICFSMSVAYHTFMANHHSYRTWLKLDVCGVLLVLVGGGHMVLWWGFHCHPTLRTIFSIVYYSVGAACIWAAVGAHSNWARAVPLTTLLVLRVASFVVRLVVATHPTPAIWHYFAMEAYSLFGGTINALRLPERWLQPKDPLKPGPLDYWLNSHQIMHVCVALAMMHLHLGATRDYETVTSILEGTIQCAAPTIESQLFA